MLDMGWLSRLALRAAAGVHYGAVTVGVQVSGHRLAAVRLRALAPLPVVDAVRQYRIEPGKLGEAVRALAHGDFLAGARVAITLGAGKYETTTIPTAPAVPEDELRDALRWQLRGALAYPPEEANFDFVRLPQAGSAGPGGGGNSGANGAILIVSAQRREVALALAPFYAAGIEPDALDIPEMAQRNLLGAGAGMPNCRGFLSFDDTTSLLTVQLGDDLCFARRMQLPGAGAPAEDEPEHLADRIATNVQRSLEVFARQSSLPEVALVTVGTHAHASLIARAIREQAEVATALFDPAVVVANPQVLPADPGR